MWGGEERGGAERGERESAMHGTGDDECKSEDNPGNATAAANGGYRPDFEPEVVTNLKRSLRLVAFHFNFGFRFIFFSIPFYFYNGWISLSVAAVVMLLFNLYFDFPIMGVPSPRHMQRSPVEWAGHSYEAMARV